MIFSDPGEGELTVTVKSRGGTSQLVARTFELQIVGDGDRRRNALDQPTWKTHIRYQNDAGEWQNAEGTRVDAEKLASRSLTTIPRR